MFCYNKQAAATAAAVEKEPGNKVTTPAGGTNDSNPEESVEELPQQGTTRNLLAKWRSMEISAPVVAQAYKEQPQPEIHEEEMKAHMDEEPTVAIDNTGNDLPPTAFTKNMLARYQSLVEEQQTQPAVKTPTRKVIA